MDQLVDYWTRQYEWSLREYDRANANLRNAKERLDHLNTVLSSQQQTHLMEQTDE